MPASRNRPPVFTIGVTALAVTGVIWFVFLRNAPPPQAQAQTGPAVTPVNEPAAEPTPARKEKPKPEIVYAPPPIQDAALRQIRELAAGGRWAQARTEIGKVFAGDMTDAQREEIVEISKKAHDRIFGAADGPDVELYEIVMGDALSKIANKFKHLHGQYGFIMLLNGMTDPAGTLRLGKKLRIPKGTWSLVADKSLFKLWICYEGAPYREFRIAIGTDEKTPAGVFTVGNKNPKPAWYPPAEMIPDLKKKGVPIPIPYGHPENPLGDYWIALDHKEYQGLGIHGTNDPKSIGTKASNGCLRMGKEDVMWIAWSTHPGMVVTITE